MGCIITAEELKLALDNAGCETKDGAYKVRGNITSFMGLGDEFCIGDDAEYFANGEAM